MDKNKKSKMDISGIVAIIFILLTAGWLVFLHKPKEKVIQEKEINKKVSITSQKTEKTKSPTLFFKIDSPKLVNFIKNMEETAPSTEKPNDVLDEIVTHGKIEPIQKTCLRTTLSTNGVSLLIYSSKICPKKNNPEEIPQTYSVWDIDPPCEPILEENGNGKIWPCADDTNTQ